MTLDRRRFIRYSLGHPDGTMDMHPKCDGSNPFASLTEGFGQFELCHAAWANLPLRVRVRNRVSEAMLALDEAVQMCESEGQHNAGAIDILPPLQVLFRDLSDYLNDIGD